MSTTVYGDLCRVTVVGPKRRVDLAVPATSPVAALIPVLLRHTTDGDGLTDPGGGRPWMLQRLGERPFDPSGTPETLDWLDGEELHLRAAEDTLPELDFDDLADGIATVINRRSDRWRPEYRRYVFLVLSMVQLALIGAVLFDRGPVALQTAVGASISVALIVGMVLAVRRRADDALAGLLYAGACGFGALTGVNVLDGDPEAIRLTSTALLGGCAGAAATAAVPVALGRLWDKRLPYALPLGVLATAAVTLLTSWMYLGVGLSLVQAAAVVATLGLTLIVFAPKLVLRAARLRGPQLPRTGEELKIDSDPASSAVVESRARAADVYLSVIVTAVSVVMPFLLYTLIGDRGWVAWGIAGMIASSLLLRARQFLGVWQRIPLSIAGSAGCVMFVLAASGLLDRSWRGAFLGLLGVTLAALLLAALRPWPRRLLPIWELMATVFDVVTALALLPLLLQLLGLYGWARGLFG
jgi:type VII secretion integral membrane protein EccD